MKSHARRLNLDDARIIRACYAEKQRIEREYSMKGLARKFDVTPNTIYQITSGKTHKEEASA